MTMFVASKDHERLVTHFSRHHGPMQRAVFFPAKQVSKESVFMDQQNHSWT
jgi:hypothetical protein